MGEVSDISVANGSYLQKVVVALEEHAHLGKHAVHIQAADSTERAHKEKGQREGMTPRQITRRKG
jgi:hypothetical protein